MRRASRANCTSKRTKKKLADGPLYPETLAKVTSLAEESKQKALKPEVSRKMGLHLNNTVTIQTKRRFLSSMPSTIEDLRNKCQVMTHKWFLAQMRQPTVVVGMFLLWKPYMTRYN